MAFGILRWVCCLFGQNKLVNRECPAHAHSSNSRIGDGVSFGTGMCAMRTIKTYCESQVFMRYALRDRVEI